MYHFVVFYRLSYINVLVLLIFIGYAVKMYPWPSAKLAMSLKLGLLLAGM